MFFIVFMATLACNDKGKKPDPVPQSKPVVLRIGDDDSPVPNEITNDQIEPLLDKSNIEQQYWSVIVPIVNMIRSPCVDSWNAELTLAQSLVKPEKCLQDHTILNKIYSDLLLKQPVETIISSLAMPGPYFKERDSEEVIEIWIDSETVVFKQIIERLVQLPTHNVRFHVHGPETQLVKQLHSLNVIKLSTEAVQSMQIWLKSGKKIESLLSQLNRFSVQSSNSSSFTKNNNSLELFGIRSSPTWFIKGYRLRGLQSSKQIKRIFSYP
jgi:hypothetical protein